MDSEDQVYPDSQVVFVSAEPAVTFLQESAAEENSDELIAQSKHPSLNKFCSQAAASVLKSFHEHTTEDSVAAKVDEFVNEGESAEFNQIFDAPHGSARRGAEGVGNTWRTNIDDSGARAPPASDRRNVATSASSPGVREQKSATQGSQVQRHEVVQSGGKTSSHHSQRALMHLQPEAVASASSGHLVQAHQVASESPDCRVNLCSRKDFMYDLHDDEETSDENGGAHFDAQKGTHPHLEQSSALEASANPEIVAQKGSVRRSYGRTAQTSGSDAKRQVHVNITSNAKPSNHRDAGTVEKSLSSPMVGASGNGSDWPSLSRRNDPGRSGENKISSISPSAKNQIRTRNQKQTQKLSPSAIVTRAQPFVLVCGRTAERQEQVSIVRKLGGKSAYSHHFDPDTTHVLCTELRRTEKFLCACAVTQEKDLTGPRRKPEYLQACAQNGRWLDPTEYEWHEPKKESAETNLWHGAPRRWRLFRERNGHGPFEGRRFLIHENTNPPAAVLAQVIAAGGGSSTVCSESSILRSVSGMAEGTTTILLPEDGGGVAASSSAASERFELVKASYILDYL
eukprot:757923-Hanusia_phi.AAC.4